jgi:hypothetical protein
MDSDRTLMRRGGLGVAAAGCRWVSLYCVAFGLWDRDKEDSGVKVCVNGTGGGQRDVDECGSDRRDWKYKQLMDYSGDTMSWHTTILVEKGTEVFLCLVWRSGGTRSAVLWDGEEQRAPSPGMRFSRRTIPDGHCSL